MKWRPFQQRIIAKWESGQFDVVVACWPRGQGKSTLAAHLCFRGLTPGDSLFHEGQESHLVAKSIDSSRRTCFKALRRLVQESDRADDYRISESRNGCSVVHKPTNTRCSVVASTAGALLGLLKCPAVVVDEPGSYELEAGAAMWAALRTGLSKPESPLRLFVIGHFAPRAVSAGHWYYDLVKRGTRGRTFVSLIQGRREKWSLASEIRRCSPLSWGFKRSRAKLLEQRDDAQSDSSQQAEFMGYNLNLPTRDQARVLLTDADLDQMDARPVPAPEGRPIVGLDLGGSRAFSAAAAVWPNGRVECVAVMPGIPTVDRQEKRDGVPPGTYAKLVKAGVLHVAEGLHVPEPRQLLGLVAPWMPRAIIADEFKYPNLKDLKLRRLSLRRPRWKESTADIGGLRKLARDGTLCVVPEARPLLLVSLTAGRVLSDEHGGVRFEKSGTNNQGRDDVAQALIFAAGAVSRMRPRSEKAAAVVCG